MTLLSGINRKLLTTVILLVVAASALTSVSIAWFSSAVDAHTDGEFSASSIVSYFADGDGSKDDPYIIAEPHHLYNLAWLQNKGVFNEHTYFKVSDINGNPTKIDMAGEIGGTTTTSGAIPPIGTNAHPFVGSFDGNGSVISNLWISTDIKDWKEHPEGSGEYSSTHVGLFASIGGTATITDFILDRVEVKSHINSTVGIVGGYVDAKITDVAVYNGIITLTAGIKCNSKYSLIGEFSENVTWEDMPELDADHSNEGGTGADLIINPSDPVFTNIADGGYDVVDGAIKGTAFYAGPLNQLASKKTAPPIWDMRNYQSGDKSSYQLFVPQTATEQKIKKILDENTSAPILIEMQSAPFNSDGSVKSMITANYTDPKTNAASSVTIPKYGIWFNPQNSGMCGLVFCNNNRKEDRYMMIYECERANGTLRVVSKTEFVLPKENNINNGDMVYYEYEIHEDDVDTYEYVIGLSDRYNQSGSIGEFGFSLLMLAGTDANSGHDPGEGDDGEEPYKKVICDIDYVISPNVDVSASTYKNHKTLLRISEATMQAGGSIYYRAIGNLGESDVYYYIPTAMGAAITDISADKESVSTTDISVFEQRDDGS